MMGESDQNVFLIHIHVDASSFAEFETSEFDISRFGCTLRLISETLNKGKSVRIKIWYVLQQIIVP